ncbi:MAG: 5'-deoxynucleotidase [Oscillospiraceae bacterium]|nr:5'-deoxynucleotidase [Oscillospiraceae bacterium]
MFHFFAYISRLKYISRWSLMRNSVTENVQEHSHMAAVLAHALGVIRRDVFGKPCDPNACAAAALFHDASEIFTGDLPTPIKYFNAELEDAYRHVENAASQKLLDMLPGSMRPAYESLLLEDDPEIRKIVKAADKLCAYIKCVEELAVGNREFSDAARVTAKALEQMQLEEVSWFLEHFGPSFGLTLDGLG